MVASKESHWDPNLWEPSNSCSDKLPSLEHAANMARERHLIKYLK